jgi:hypothetical protein
MGLREKLNENPAITTAVAAGIILVALIFLGWNLLPGGGNTAAIGENDAFYTTDNGQSWEPGGYFDIYEASAGGQEKFRAKLFKWTEDGEPFVGWMERVTPEAAQAYRDSQASGAGDPLMMMAPEDAMTGLYVARPPSGDGEPQWFAANSEQGSEIMQPPLQDGQRAIPVYP